MSAATAGSALTIAPPSPHADRFPADPWPEQVWVRYRRASFAARSLYRLLRSTSGRGRRAFWGRDAYLAERLGWRWDRHSASSRRVRERLRELEELGLVVRYRGRRTGRVGGSLRLVVLTVGARGGGVELPQPWASGEGVVELRKISIDAAHCTARNLRPERFEHLEPEPWELDGIERPDELLEDLDDYEAELDRELGIGAGATGKGAAGQSAGHYRSAPLYARASESPQNPPRVLPPSGGPPAAPPGRPGGGRTRLRSEGGEPASVHWRPEAAAGPHGERWRGWCALVAAADRACGERLRLGRAHEAAAWARLEPESRRRVLELAAWLAANARALRLRRPRALLHYRLTERAAELEANPDLLLTDAQLAHRRAIEAAGDSQGPERETPGERVSAALPAFGDCGPLEDPQEAPHERMRRMLLELRGSGLLERPR